MLNCEQLIGVLQPLMHALSLNDSIPHLNPDRLLECDRVSSPVKYC